MQKKLSVFKDAYFCFFAILFVSLAILGGFRNYSSIPFWDMWNGYLDFYTKISAGDWSAWWAQHNEHRIVLARIFFWLDIRYFHGQGWLLIILNYLILSLATLVIVIVGSKLLDQKEDRYLLLFLVAWMFFWSQNENLIWGFQSEFFLAFLLPLISILLLWKSCQPANSKVPYFFLSLLIGIASVGTLANGIITLPLLFLYSLLLKVSWRRSFALFLFSVLCICLYFYAYTQPPSHGSLFSAIKTDFFGLIRYMARYLGSPFVYVIGDRFFKKIAEFLGFVVLFFTLYQFATCYLKSKINSLNFALLIFVTYVILTGFVTAGGRLIFGLDQAFSSRYTTPAIMVWSVVFLILAQSIPRRRKKIMIFGLGVLLVCMIPQQFKATKNRSSDFTERSVAALSLALNLEDESQIKSILPSAKWGLELSKVPREKGYSIFGYGDVYKLENFLKSSRTIKPPSSKSCHGSIDVIKKMEFTEDYYFISGWIYDEKVTSSLRALQMFDYSGFPTGAGFVGIQRQDVVNSMGYKATYSGFKGYLKKETFDHDLIYILIDQGCTLKSRLPLMSD